EAYAYSMFKNYDADACTVNGYLGIDGVKPFLNYKEKGVFILVKTSNPSSEDFQNLFSIKLSDVANEITEFEVKNAILKRNYLLMAELIHSWNNELIKPNEFTNLGAVVGATFPNELRKVRKILKNSFILIPGYGAQGAQASDIKFGFNNNGLGGIVNSSRRIIYSYAKNKKFGDKKFGEAARYEIIDMNLKINNEIKIN
ncbi:MAG: orotidine-5'-phosphate decarboxylase, partial [Promethearchaeota archaeon]